MSIKFYVLGGPHYKPPGVSRGCPWLYFIIMFMLMQLFVCCDQNKVQFNSVITPILSFSDAEMLPKHQQK